MQALRQRSAVLRVQCRGVPEDGDGQLLVGAGVVLNEVLRHLLSLAVRVDGHLTNQSSRSGPWH